jgi:stage V sporulation protein G
VGFASVVLNNDFYLGSIGIHKKIDGSGYRITYPTKQIGDRSINIYHPINAEASKSIEEAIISKAEQILKP